MANIIIPNVFTPATVADANAVNANFTAVANAINEGLTSYPTFINAVAPPYGMAVANTPAQNTTALQAAIWAAITAGGGTVFIPAGTYNMASAITISGLTGGIIIQGASAGTKLVVQGNGDLFDVTGNYGTYGGTRFRDLQLVYASATSGIAINVQQGGEATTAEFCEFTNCPQAMALGGAQGGMFGCRVYQNNIANTTQVTISKPECYVSQCLLLQQPISTGGPVGCIGINVQSGADQAWIINNHISDFNQGVVISGGKFTFITNCAIQSWTNSVYVVPKSGGSANCVFLVGNHIPADPATTAQSSGVYIDSNGGPSTNASGIYGSGNLIYGWGNAGLQVNVAQDVVFNGGQISSNGLNPSAANLGANVVVSAAALRVSLNGVDMSGTVPIIGAASPYALSVFGSGACLANLCDMTLCSTGPLLASSPGSLSLTSCNGYNNIVSIVSTATPANGAQITLASLGHYGPGTMYVSGGTVSAIELFEVSSFGVPGQVLGITSGTVVIPNPYTAFSIAWSGSPTVAIIGS